MVFVYFYFHLQYHINFANLNKGDYKYKTERKNTIPETELDFTSGRFSLPFINLSIPPPHLTSSSHISIAMLNAMQNFW